MALRDLLVYLDQTDSALTRLQLAADLALRNSSHLTALFIRVRDQGQKESCNTAELGLVSASPFTLLNQRIESTITRAADRLLSVVRGLEADRGLKAQWRCESGFPAVVVPQHARYADLCILGHDNRDPCAADGFDPSTEVDYSFSEKVLFVTGRPVLFVPTVGSFETLGSNVAIAWNSSRAAARALKDALPLIERAAQTTIFAVNPTSYTTRYRALPPQHLVEHLRRHGVRAQIVEIEDIPTQSIADALQSRALEIGADLMVSGAFGHARIREKLLGGVTQSLLQHMRLPILMSY